MKNITLERSKKYSHLSLAEREEIAIGLENGQKQCEIATLLKRNPSTISREIKRNNPSIRTVRYRANRAQLKAEERKQEKLNRKRLPNKRLRRFIIKNLKKGYSPEIIAFLATAKNSRWKTNYETIYQWIYNERKDLIPFLTQRCNGASGILIYFLSVHQTAWREAVCSFEGFIERIGSGKYALCSDLLNCIISLRQHLPRFFQAFGFHIGKEGLASNCFHQFL